jgi:hypothetical protein
MNQYIKTNLKLMVAFVLYVKINKKTKTNKNIYHFLLEETELKK